MTNKSRPSTMKVYPESKKSLRRIQARHINKFGTTVSFERLLLAMTRLLEYDPQLVEVLLNKELK